MQTRTWTLSSAPMGFLPSAPSTPSTRRTHDWHPDSAGDYTTTTITGVGDDFFETNRFGIALTVPEYTRGDEADSAAVWDAVRTNPGLAIVSATIVPSRTNAAFALPSAQFTLNDVEDLLIENEDMEPVQVTVRDRASGNTLDLKVIGVLDTLASNGPIPVGFYASQETLGRDVNATQFFFNIEGGVEDGSAAIEAAFFQNGVETLDVKELIAEAQAAQKALFNLLIGFMSLGLLVGIAALGIISARTVRGTPTRHRCAPGYRILARNGPAELPRRNVLPRHTRHRPGGLGWA